MSFNFGDIARSRAMGYSDEAIRQALIQARWDASLVDAALAQLPRK